MTTAEHLERLYSGETTEEILAGNMAACGFFSPVRAGLRLPGGETAYPIEKGEYQIKMKWGLSANGYTVEIHVGADTYEEWQMKFKQALLEAARALLTPEPEESTPDA